MVLIDAPTWVWWAVTSIEVLAVLSVVAILIWRQGRYPPN